MNLYANKNFQNLFSITVLSAISSTIFTFIIPLMLYDLTKSALAMSTMRVMEFLPNVLLGMLAGVIVDRFNRNLMLTYGGLIKFILAILLWFSITANEPALWQLYILGFLLSTVSYTVGNASNAITPQLFDKSSMTEIQSKFSLIYTLSAIVGPSLIGALLVWLSYDHFLAIYVICMGLCWGLSHRIERTATPDHPVKQSIIADMKEGVRELIGNKQVFAPTITILVTNFGTSLCIGVLAFYVLDVLGNSKEQLGFMYTISAVGGILGAKLISPLRKKFRRGQIYAAFPLIDVAVLVLFYFAHSWILLGILLAFRTCLVTMSNIIFLAIRQESTPNHLLGRVAGTSSMLMKLALPVGLLIGGIWAETLPIPWIFLLAAVAMLSNFFILKRAKFSEVE